MKKCLILANGQAPEKSIFSYLDEIGFNTLICADGGANNAFELFLKPSYIIGDLDSVKEDVLNYYREEAEIIHYTRQNDTDVEKCLKYSVNKGFEEAILLGATGNRLDHTFCNMQIVMKFREKINVHILHQKSFLSVLLEGEHSFKTKPGEIISLYGIYEKTTITTKGLKYTLNNEPLPFGTRDGTSNEAVDEEITVDVNGGKIFLIREFEVLKENGFLYSR